MIDLKYWSSVVYWQYFVSFDRMTNEKFLVIALAIGLWSFKDDLSFQMASLKFFERLDEFLDPKTL